MNKYIILLFTFLSLACSDQLDLYPETNLTEGNYYNTEEELLLAANDVYRQICRIYDANGIPDLYGERFSDNICVIFTDGANTYTEDVVLHQIKSDNGTILTAWRTAYNAIAIVNDVLERLENTSVSFSSDELYNRTKAEALFVRSLVYFNLIQAFGDVPFPLKVVSVDESYSYLRENKDNIYRQIIEDLKFCKDNLPESYQGNDVGRITTFAASAIMAKVYLMTQEKDLAKVELKRIIDSGKYSLDSNGDGVINEDDYEFLFLPDTKNCKESILEAQYLSGVDNVNAQHQNQYTPFLWSFHLPGSSDTFRGGGKNTPSDDLIAEYEDNDPRLEISIIPGFQDEGANIWVDHPYTNKFYDPNWQNPGQNFEIIRYADILLLYSELTNDASYLNQVRSRVGLPLFGDADYPKQYKTLKEAIEHERRVELAFEFHRFFDLMRTGRALDVFNSKGFNLSQEDLLFPIPLVEIDINPALVQNPGY